MSGILVSDYKIAEGPRAVPVFRAKAAPDQTSYLDDKRNH
jgi:hypothetical protein